MTDVIVVGAGLFGCIIAAALRKEGASVLQMSEYRDGAGSPPAGCVIRPSWVTSMKKAELTECLELLADLYTLKDQEFEIRPSGKMVKCYRLEPDEILYSECPHLRPINKCVVSVKDDEVITVDGKIYNAKVGVVLACGIWAQELAPWVGTVTPKWGVSFRGPKIEQPFIKLWAPFRQIVAFNLKGGQSWIGDGSAFNKYSAERLKKSIQRCCDATGWGQTLIEFVGARPYADTGGKPCLLRRGPRRQWAVTGGAKNGTAGAAWAAIQLKREILG